jgi:hypothetical protein
MPLIIRADVFASSPINAINKTNKAASDQQGGRGQKPGQQQQQPNQKPGQGRNVRLKRPARRNAAAVGAASFPGLIAMTARRSDQPSRSRRLITMALDKASVQFFNGPRRGQQQGGGGASVATP